MIARHGTQDKLFDSGVQLPTGLVYRPDFISLEEEFALIAAIDTAPMERARYREYRARRLSTAYGWGWDRGRETFVPGDPLPSFLVPLQRKVAKWLGIPRGRVVEALINEYPPGAAIGWHRDNEGFEHIVGISLGAWCTMRWRPFYKKDRGAITSLELEPRSAYIMQHSIRWDYQHSVPPTRAHRYSITLRTLPT